MAQIKCKRYRWAYVSFSVVVLIIFICSWFLYSKKDDSRLSDSMQTISYMSFWQKTTRPQGARIRFLSSQADGYSLSTSGDRRSSLIQLYGHSWFPLPNYFITGKSRGLTQSDYTNGVTVFLHHNKAAGTTVKTCLINMQRRGIINGSEPIVVSSGERVKLHLQAQEDVRMEHYSHTNYFMGGYSFGMCDYFEPTEKCSYFTFMRDPIDRVISSYFYCHQIRSDQLCGPVFVRNFTIEEWAISQGSYFFYQLLLHPVICKRISSKFRTGGLYNSNDNIILQTLTTSMRNLTYVQQCWFRQRQYFEKVLSDIDLQILFDYIVDNLENWFAFIGLTEDFNLSLNMLSRVYAIPFDKHCNQKTNAGKYVKGFTHVHNTSSRELTKPEMRKILIGNSEVTRALNFDMLLYNKGKEIYLKQRRIFYETINKLGDTGS